MSHLVTAAWTNIGYTVTGTNLTGETLNFVTNAVDTEYIRLRIDRQE